MKLAIDESKTRIKNKYLYELEITDYNYDSENNVYVVMLKDKESIESSLIYDPSSNTFTDNYENGYISVLKSKKRGEIINMFEESDGLLNVIDNVYVDLTKINKKSIINDDNTNEQKIIINILTNEINKKEIMPAIIYDIYDSLKDIQYDSVNIYAPCPYGTLFYPIKKDEIVPKNSTDISNRIAYVSSFYFG